MDAQRWRQVRRVFDDVVVLPAAQRDAALAAACGDDADLVAEVRALLAADQAGTDSFALAGAMPALVDAVSRALDGTHDPQN